MTWTSRARGDDERDGDGNIFPIVVSFASSASASASASARIGDDERSRRIERAGIDEGSRDWIFCVIRLLSHDWSMGGGRAEHSTMDSDDDEDEPEVKGRRRRRRYVRTR